MADSVVTLRAIITGSSAGAVKAFDETAVAADEASRKSTASVSQSHGQISSMFTSLGAVGVGALGAIAVGAVVLADRFDASTNQIAASAGISEAAAHKIGQAFLSASNGTIYSGQQWASAYAAVAGQLGQLNGKALTATQAVGVMTAATNLAEASGESLASSTSDLAGVMQAYGIGVNQAASVSNVLYSASKLTGTSIDTEASSLEKLKAKLGAAAPPISQLAGLQLDLAHNGETGRKGITALGTATTGLLMPTTSAYLSQKKLGLEVETSKGKFAGWGSVIAQLQPKLAGMSQEQQLATLKAIGLGSANLGLLQTINAGPAAYDKDVAAVSKSGAAHDAAQKSTANLKDTIAKIKVEVENEGVKIGEALLPKLASLLSITMKVVDWVGKHKVVVAALALVIGGVLVGAIAAWTASTIAGMVATLAAIAPATAFGAAMTTTAIAIDSAIIPIAAVVAGIALLAVGAYEIYKHWGTIAHFFEGLWDDVKKIFDKAWDAIKGIFDSALNAIKSHLGIIIPIIVGLVTGPIGLLVLELVKHWSTIKADVTKAWDDIVHFISGIPGKILDALSSLGSKLASWISSVWSSFSGFIQNAWNAEVSWWSQLPGRIINAVSSLASKIGSWISSVWSSFAGAVVAGWNAEVSFWTGLPGKIVSAVGDGAQVLLQWGKDLVTGIVNGVTSIAGQIGSAISSAIRSGINAAKSALNSIPVVGHVFSAIGLATGGYVTQPTLALVGEAGPEFVIPESQLKEGFAAGIRPLPANLPIGTNPTGTTTNANPVTPSVTTSNVVNINAITNATADDIAREVGWAMRTATVA